VTSAKLQGTFRNTGAMVPKSKSQFLRLLQVARSPKSAFHSGLGRTLDRCGLVAKEGRGVVLQTNLIERSDTELAEFAWVKPYLQRIQLWIEKLFVAQPESKKQLIPTWSNYERIGATVQQLIPHDVVQSHINDVTYHQYKLFTKEVLLQELERRSLFKLAGSPDEYDRKIESFNFKQLGLPEDVLKRTEAAMALHLRRVAEYNAAKEASYQKWKNSPAYAEYKREKQATWAAGADLRLQRAIMRGGLRAELTKSLELHAHESIELAKDDRWHKDKKTHGHSKVKGMEKRWKRQHHDAWKAARRENKVATSTGKVNIGAELSGPRKVEYY